MTEDTVQQFEFDSLCSYLQLRVKDLEWQVRQLLIHTTVVGVDDSHETKANVILTLRHLEDARTRLGRAIEASQKGDA